MIKFYDHQVIAAKKLKTGSILWGGVGSGKSLTALLYYNTKEKGKKLFIITTAKKRDSKDWENECKKYGLELSLVTVDSWNNIKKYTDIESSFFVFDEQRVVGSGAWVRSFLKITKKNNWILLSATPGDTWLDYVPVFVANGFYKNRTQFVQRHVVYNPFVIYPKVDKYLEIDKLETIKKHVLVEMKYTRPAKTKHEIQWAEYDETGYLALMKDRFNIYENRPVRNSAELCFLARRLVNENQTRFRIISQLLVKHKKLVVFYNFNYELDVLRTFDIMSGVEVAEYNGHKHEEIPNAASWVYLVQYLSGAEGWNCTQTNAVVFYSQNYSYRIMRQAAGRIDRLDTPFAKLYYYHILSRSPIDQAIRSALRKKQNFNASNFLFAE